MLNRYCLLLPLVSCCATIESLFFNHLLQFFTLLVLSEVNAYFVESQIVSVMVFHVVWRSIFMFRVHYFACLSQLFTILQCCLLLSVRS
jgi:hypothetical protein